MSTDTPVLSRRRFLGYSAVAGAGLLAGSTTTRLAFAAPNSPSAGDVAVVVFLRGGADGLSLVAPYTESRYISERPTTALGAPDKPGGALYLDEQFGLHPALGALHSSAWSDNNLAVVHGVGLSDSMSRSHFEAQQFWERSSVDHAIRNGWLARLLGATPSQGAVSGIGMGNALARSLVGAPDAVSMSGIDRFAVRGFQRSASAEAALAELYGADASLVGVAGSGVLRAVDVVRAAAPGDIAPQNGAVYADGNGLGSELRQIAQLIRANVGLRAAIVSIGGWDMHNNMGGAEGGEMAVRAKQLGDALSAFYTDLGADMNEVTLVTMSEFGRTIKENGSRGTDHGRGSAMFVMGRSVNGGMYTDWPGLEEYEGGRDLRVTIDFRTVLAELADRRYGAANLGDVFPGFSVPSYVGVASV